jgi:hypothetical protein
MHFMMYREAMNPSFDQDYELLDQGYVPKGVLPLDNLGV